MSIVSEKNIDIAKTQITDKIRVSSAALFYEELFGSFYQYETWVFSDDPKQPSKMVIHGTYHELNDQLETKTKIIHEYISNELIDKFV